MPWLLGSAALWFSGFALLLPVAPLWVIHGGSDDLGAGLVTGVMMACTVLAQLSMRRVLPGLGWRWTLALGSGLLGLPALGHSQPTGCGLSRRSPRCADSGSASLPCAVRPRSPPSWGPDAAGGPSGPSG